MSEILSTPKQTALPLLVHRFPSINAEIISIVLDDCDGDVQAAQNRLHSFVSDEDCNQDAEYAQGLQMAFDREFTAHEDLEASDLQLAQLFSDDEFVAALAADEKLQEMIKKDQTAAPETPAPETSDVSSGSEAPQSDEIGRLQRLSGAAKNRMRLLAVKWSARRNPSLKYAEDSPDSRSSSASPSSLGDAPSPSVAAGSHSMKISPVVAAFAEQIGIDLVADGPLLWIAEEGIMQVPEGWSKLETAGELMYVKDSTGVKQKDHPRLKHFVEIASRCKAGERIISPTEFLVS